MDSSGRIGYLGLMAEKPLNHPDPTRSNLVMDWREVTIRDARAIPGGATLASHGFTAVAHHTAVTNWDGDGWLEIFTGEALDLVHRASGASEVAVTRNSRRGQWPFVIRDSRNSAAGAVGFCHNDHTPGSAPLHLATDYPDRVRSLFAKRFAIYNLWHPITPPPQSHPLALCDPSSVAAADMISCGALTADESRRALAENAMFRHNPAHRWYYYPDLGTDETLIWCAFDSDPSRPSIVPHAAFRDPACTDPDGKRISVDGLIYAFFD